MNTVLQEKSNLIIQNYKKCKSSFKWENATVNHFSALVYTMNNKVIDCNEVNEIKRYIKANTSTFSYFQGNNMQLLAILLSNHDDYKTYFKKTLAVYDQLKANKFKASSYLTLSAYSLVSSSDLEFIDHTIKKAYSFYKKMKENHFWLTSNEDYGLAVALGMTEHDVNHATNDIERCYQYLSQNGFSKGSRLQSLTHILAFSLEESTLKCHKALKLYHLMKNKGYKLTNQCLPLLGVLTLIGNNLDSITNDIIEVYEYLIKQKGYGRFSLSKEIRLILAISLVSSQLIEETDKELLNTVIGNSITAIIIAQQTAMIAAISASTVAATAANSSN